MGNINWWWNRPYSYGSITSREMSPKESIIIFGLFFLILLIFIGLPLGIYFGLFYKKEHFQNQKEKELK
jgi:hypothetical protein